MKLADMPADQQMMIKELVERAPPLSARQRHRLETLFAAAQDEAGGDGETE